MTVESVNNKSVISFVELTYADCRSHRVRQILLGEKYGNTFSLMLAASGFRCVIDPGIEIPRHPREGWPRK